MAERTTPVDVSAPIAATRQSGAGRHPAVWLLVLVGAPLFVIAAVALEITGGLNANSPVPSWAHVVPIAWPQWARVLWWSAVAISAASFRMGLRRAGLRTTRAGDAVAITPFLGLAIGVLMGAEWATWH